MTQTAKGYEHGPPYDSGFLGIGSIHKIHYEQYGKQDGKPVVFLHGGPGGSTSLKNTIFFNPAIYRVILFDQRGSGQSLPLGELRENDSKHLVADIEALREHLGIHRWHVFGGSWGATLATLYAQAHPDPVVSLTLRGIYFKPGDERQYDSAMRITFHIHPELYHDLVGHLTEEERSDIMLSYGKRFASEDRAVALAAAKMYERWAATINRRAPKVNTGEEAMTEDEGQRLISSCRIDNLFYLNTMWIKELRYMEPDSMEKIKHIPCSIVNGRYDLICPSVMAWQLHRALPNSKLFIIPDAGHTAYEPPTQDKLVEICDEFAELPL